MRQQGWFGAPRSLDNSKYNKLFKSVVNYVIIRNINFIINEIHLSVVTIIEIINLCSSVSTTTNTAMLITQ